jgi:HlyD family type I secretion membrane fusion protein
MSNLPSLARQKRDVSVNVLVSAFESETASVFVRTTPASEHLVLYVIVSMMVLALVLMGVTKLDRIVSGTGRIISSEGSLYIQPLDKAIIRSIKVKVGDVVKKGQVLAALDPTFAGADLAQLQEKMASTRAQVARLEAEHADKTYSAVGGDRYELLQQASFQQRQSEFRSSLADFDARIHSDEAKIVSLQADVGTYRQRLKVASDIEGMNAKLERDGWGSRLKTLTATDARVEVARLLSESQNQIKANAQSLQALQAQRSVYIEKFHAETTSDLVTARDALVKIQEDLKKAQKVNQLISLEAPADAIVLKVANASVGSVVGPTADNSQGALFTLVPLDDKLEAEVRIDAKDIGFLEVGDTVQVKLDAYSYIRHGTAQGVIETISEGSFTQGENENQVRSPYFKARVALTDVHLHDVPRSFRLIPGMTVVADVMIGKRTILSYLVDGALRTGSEAMREP